jgi:hypothetical protein
VTKLIELEYDAITFPSTCPVCGKSATTEGTIPAMSKHQREEGKTLFGWSFPSSRVVASTRSMPHPDSPANVTIPTCDDHALSFEDTKRLRSTMSFLSGLFIVIAALFAIIFAGSSLGAQAINIQLLSVTLVFGLGAIITYSVSGPSALERSVVVYDMRSDMSMVVLRISNSDYAEELLKLNPTLARKHKLEPTIS